MTIAVIANSDGANELARERAEVTVELVERLLTGDVDGDGVPDRAPVESVRVLVTYNVPMRHSEPLGGGCTEVWLGGAWAPRSDCSGAVRTVFDVEPGQAFRDDLRCHLDMTGLDTECVPETFAVALAALSPSDSPLDLAPLVGLGDGPNVAYRERGDVLVVVLQSPDQRDDCSRRILASPRAEGICLPPEEPYCCDQNLPEVTRTSSALRQVLAARAVVYAAYGQHPAFSPNEDPEGVLDQLVETGTPFECYRPGGHPHDRTVRLAHELYPDMHLLPLTCTPEPGGLPDVTALARDVFSRFCE